MGKPKKESSTKLGAGEYKGYCNRNWWAKYHSTL
jgi:hypothetical protein